MSHKVDKQTGKIKASWLITYNLLILFVLLSAWQGGGIFTPLPLFLAGIIGIAVGIIIGGWLGVLIGFIVFIILSIIGVALGIGYLP
jgi:hypothetical protein